MSAPVLSVKRPLSPSSRRLRAVSTSLACCAVLWASKSGIPKVAMRGPASVRGRATGAVAAPALARTRTPPTTLAVAPPRPPTDEAGAAQGAPAPPMPPDAVPARGATADAEAAGEASSAQLATAASPEQSPPPSGPSSARAAAPRPLPPADPAPARVATVDATAAGEASGRVPATGAVGADTARDALRATPWNSFNLASGIAPSTRPCHPFVPC